MQATSSIDLETDEAVQQILRGTDFEGVTTITVLRPASDSKFSLTRMKPLQIAHRINTIMDSDRVLVMSDGKVAEYDSPEKLLENPVSSPRLDAAPDR
jgi:ATP-binding cassette subfamily C (CFTR/MRP) protein 1